MINNYAVRFRPKSPLRLFIYIFFIKDPCKKCLISSCCSKVCENKINYLSYCDIDGNIKYQRFISASVIFSILSILITIIKVI